MSSQCGNCNCADKSQCGKRNNYGVDIVETERSYIETVVGDAPAEETCTKCNSCTCLQGGVCQCSKPCGCPGQ